ncbi:MAG TPA: alpha/beta hydrolase [Phycisphaerae bacterium]|nr:alpha/beta hydrolase [Phycisphaerae bacterium]HRY70174.1 alpha/beta hydrolase [Phycisphaerae bacterium]HSA27389.1 alpha/beta hydrolase [Phycisphaerae bacterium]
MTHGQVMEGALPRSMLVAAILAAAVSPCCQRELMPTPNLFAASAADPFGDVPPELRNNRVDVLYGTDRRPIRESGGGLGYGYQRSKSLAFGICTIRIGRDLPWEELVRQSRAKTRSLRLPLSVAEIRETGRFPPTPVPVTQDRDRFVEDPATVHAQHQNSRRLSELLSEQLRRTPRHEALLYIHGYNNEFQDGAFVAAGFWHFMGRAGVPIIYTWPAGSPFSILRGYAHDRESGEFTIYHLKQFLRAVVSCPELEKLHVIAHSRGTDVFMTALRELHIEFAAAGRETRSELKLGNVILAAADLDWEVAQERIAAEHVTLVPERITVYVSQWDRAIRIADWIFGSTQRLGQLRGSDLTPEECQALESLSQAQVIDVRVISNWTGHDYFHANPAVSSDIVLLLRDNRGAGAENGRPLFKRLDNFWEIRDGYPGGTHPQPAHP